MKGVLVKELLKAIFDAKKLINEANKTELLYKDCVQILDNQSKVINQLDVLIKASTKLRDKIINNAIC